MQMFDTLVTLLWTTRGNQELVTFTTDVLSFKLVLSFQFQLMILQKLFGLIPVPSALYLL